MQAEETEKEYDDVTDKVRANIQILLFVFYFGIPEKEKTNWFDL